MIRVSARRAAARGRIRDASLAMDREACRIFGVPEALAGLRVPWWRRIVQRFTRRP